MQRKIIVPSKKRAPDLPRTTKNLAWTSPALDRGHRHQGLIYDFFVVSILKKFCGEKKFFRARGRGQARPENSEK